MKKAMLVLGCLVALVTYAPAQEMSVISGKLLGYDGKPMLKAHVHLFPFTWPDKPLHSIEVAPDGSFEIRFMETGLRYLRFTGANHQVRSIPLWIEKPIRERINVRLILYEYVDDFNQVKIIWNFNNLDFSTSRPMTKQANGTLVFEIDTTISAFTYQILGAAKNLNAPINGTQSDDLVYSGFLGYRSVVKVSDGKVKIIFDPKKLLRGKTGDEAVVQFDNPNSPQARFYALHHEQRRRIIDEYQAAKKAYSDAHNRDITGFSYDWSTTLTAFTKLIAKETNSALRQILLMQYLEIGRLGEHEKLDKQLIAQAFAEIPATSLLWSNEIISGSAPLMFDAASWLAPKGKYDDYLDEALEKHPDRSIRVGILRNKLEDAGVQGDTAKVRVFYNRMMSEFGDTWQAKSVKSKYDPNRAIMNSKKAPKFSVVSLDQPSATYTNESMKGKIYLMDFWAVWCGPCVIEMPNLHQAYEKLKDKNFEILSLSFDRIPEDVAQFRDGEWKMPWLHSFVAKGFDSDLAKAFEVRGIPKPILVDGNTNTILATGEDLRGEQLEKTLAKVLGDGTNMSNADKQ